MHRRRGEPAGWSLVELVMVIGVSLVVGALALAAFAPLGAGARAIGAARYLAALLQRERIEAVRTGRVCGLRFDDDGSAIGFVRVADGNGNGLRSAEIAGGIDPVRGPRVRLADAFAGVRFAIVEDVPAIDGGPASGRGRGPGAPRLVDPGVRADRQRHVRHAVSRQRRSAAVRRPDPRRHRARADLRVRSRDGALGAAMSPGAERRAARRWMPRDLPWPIACRVAPGHDVAIVNLSAVGVLIEVAAPLPPGRAVTVHLVRSSRRVALAGAVARCYVVQVTRDAGARYHAAVAFSRWFEPLWELDSLGGEDEWAGGGHVGTS